jgi:phosphomannomutase
MSQLKITVSGIRGKYPDLINEHVAEQFTNAYAVWNLGKNIVVACDTRHSSPALKKVVIETLIRHGKNVIDIGIVPTPTVQVYIREKKLDGGIMVTASHNPGSDNGLKLISNQGLFLNYAEVDQINQLLSVSSANEVPGSLQEKSDADELHLNKVLQIVDTEKIKSKEFKIAFDPVNGAGAQIHPKLLKLLNCQISGIHLRMQGDFERVAEPRPENLKKLTELVKKEKADLGIALDVDADRLVLVDENGVCLPEDLTLCLVADALLSTRLKPKGNIITNLSTTNTFGDVAKKYGVQLIQTPIGEINVASRMLKENALFGGEGNGGVIIPAIGYGRDALAGVAVILNYLAHGEKTLSEWANSLPKYAMIKDKIQARDSHATKHLLNHIEKNYKADALNKEDGLKFIFNDHSWVHVRESNTEPIIRIIAEAPTTDQAQYLVNQIRTLASGVHA